MADQTTIVIRYTADGEVSFHVAGKARLLIVDEGAPGDRVFEWTQRTTPDAIAALLGEDPIGSRHDTRHAAIVARVDEYVSGKPRLSVVGEETQL